MYKPKPGENILKFTATDQEGNISTTEVKVNFYLPVVPAELTMNEFDTLVNAPSAGVFSLIATGKLSNYLLKLDQFGFDNLFQLYEYLLEHAKEEGFTKEDITSLFSVYYTQKDITVFDRELRKSDTTNDPGWDQIRDSSIIPLHYIDQLLQTGKISDVDLSNALIKIIYDGSGNSENILSELNAYSDTITDYQKDKFKDLTPEQAYKLYEKNTSIENAKMALSLSATTDKLKFFYQNLLLTSSGNLKIYLSGLQFSSQGIVTSIDLVKHLFNIAGTEGFTIEELIKTFDFVSANRMYYLVKFIDELKAEANGTLKSQLLVLDLEESNIYTYDDLLNYLLNQSQYKNYTRESVYDLFLRMIGIDNVEEFADLIRSYQYTSINKALADTSLGYFSSPFELLQYLLASAQYYEYTESDINNLLIRMILERGLSHNNIEKYKGSGKKLWRNPKFVSTIVLINIILLVLIIVVLIKRKNNS
jgi:hypothetical protein